VARLWKMSKFLL